MFNYRISKACAVTFVALFFVLSCGWEDNSPVSPYPDIRFRVYFHEDRDIIEADYCRIVVEGELAQDSLSAGYDDFAVIIAPDSGYYFYSPQQGDLDDLSLRKSIEALVSLLRSRGYFDAAPKRPAIHSESPVGIEVSGPQTEPNLLFTNNLNRFSGVVSSGQSRVLSSTFGAVVGISPFLAAELGALIHSAGNSASLPYSIAAPPDTAFLFNANSLILLLEPLSGLYIADFEGLILDSWAQAPGVVSKLSVADQMSIFAIVLRAVSPDSVFQGNLDLAKSLLEGLLAPMATEFESSLSNENIAEVSADFRASITYGMLDLLAKDDLPAVEVAVVAKALRDIALGVDSLNGVVETYSRPPFAKWAPPIPSVVIDAPISGGLFERGEPINFVGHAIDPTYGPIASDKLEWRSSIDGFMGSGANISFAPRSGEHEIILTAFNDDSVFASDTIALTVDLGRPPTVSILLPEDDSRHADTAPVDFSGYAADYEDGELFGESLVWSSSLDGVLGNGTLLSTPLSIGSHTITLTATDSDGLTASDEISLTVFQNTPPQAWIIMPQDGDTLAMVGLNIFIGGATDTEDGFVGAENLIWTSDRSGVIGTGFYFTATLIVGWHTIILTATDSGGLSGSDTIQVYVNLF